MLRWAELLTPEKVKQTSQRDQETHFFKNPQEKCKSSILPCLAYFRILLVVQSVALCFRSTQFVMFVYPFFFFDFWLRWVFVAARAFSSCSEWGLLFIAVHGLLIAVASLVVEHGLSSCGSRALEHRLSSCGARSQLLHSTWDLPRPGIEPMSPALAGRF